MARMDQDQSVKRVRWQGEIDVQMGSVDVAMKRIKTAIAEIKRLKGVAQANGATVDDLSTYDFFTSKAKTDLQKEVDRP